MKFKVKFSIILILLVFVNKSNCYAIYSKKQNDSLLIKELSNHVETYLYVARNNYNNPIFLDVAKTYSDSILKIDKQNNFALATHKKISLIKSTIENNAINKFKLYDFFNGIPNYFGFIDDPIEYAYDDALTKLLNTKYLKLHNGPIADSNITSLLIRKKCDDEMFEIINQTLISNSKHFILQSNHLENILDEKSMNNLINGELNEKTLNLILEYYNLEKLGIFIVDNLDIIENKIWHVQTDFTLFSKNDNISESIFTKGYSIDKRIYGYGWFIRFILSFLIISFIIFKFVYFSLNTFYKVFNISNKNYLGFNLWKDFKRYTAYFAFPFIISFILIYFSTLFIPSGETHYLELNVILWILLLTISNSFLPILINLFIANRFDFDGFHTSKGYIEFSSVSLISSFMYYFLIIILKYDSNITFEFINILGVVLISILTGNIMGLEFYEFTSEKKSDSNKTNSVVGILIGLSSLYFINLLFIKDFSLKSILFGLIISIFAFGITKIFNFYKSISNKKLLNLDDSQNNINKDLFFVESLIDTDNKIVNKIVNETNNELNIYIISAPKGIGKTSSLNKVRYNFIKKDWNWFYGDCDEIQNENSISYEPIFEAFNKILNQKTLTDRSNKIDKFTSKIVNKAIDSTIGINPISELKINPESTINNLCIEITEQLNTLKGNSVFVLEDLHFIDSESFSFFKQLIKTINRYESLRTKIKIILTLRDDFKDYYRGLDYENLKNELLQLNNSTDNNININNLLINTDFNVKNFVLGYTNKVKIAEKSLLELNDIFNSLIIENEGNKNHLTPLYIIKTLNLLIENNVLQNTSDGYILKKNIDLDTLPNFDDVDFFYHKIFDTFDKKWMRLLESATIIGNKFDADILALIWNYNLLEVLSFLEEAVKKEILLDLSDQDNFYEFKDKRISSAVKSYFKDDLIQFRGEKQIIIEYNKRYLSLVEEKLNFPERFKIDDNLKVVRRLISLRYIDFYLQKLHNIILDIVCRYLYELQNEKLDVFGNYLKKMELDEIGDLIIDLAYVTNHFNSTDEKKKLIVHRIINEQNLIQKLPVENSNSRNILNDIRLLILLNVDSRKNLINYNHVGFSILDLSKSDWKYLVYDFPKKLKGISKINYAKDYFKYLAEFSMLITEFEYDICDSEVINESLEVLFNEIDQELKSTEFYYIYKIEKELLNLNKIKDSKNNLDDIIEYNNIELSEEDQEELSEFDSSSFKLENQRDKDYLNKKTEAYYKILGSDIKIMNNHSLLIRVLSEFMSYSNFELKSHELSIEIFNKFNKSLFRQNSPSELWIIFFLKFINSSTCTCKKTLYNKPCNCDKIGEIFINNNPKEAYQYLNIASDFLIKISEFSTLSTVSNLLFETKKVFALTTEKYNDLENIITIQKNKIGKTYGKESSEYNKYLINHANEFSRLKLYESAIKFRKESLDYPMSKLNKNQIYLSIAKDFRKIEKFDDALNYAEKSLSKFIDILSEKIPEGWDVINNSLVPISNDIEKLFLFGKKEQVKIKPIIRFAHALYKEFGIIYLNKNRFNEAEENFQKSLNYVTEKYMYVHYYILKLHMGINYKNIDFNIGNEIIENSINKLSEEKIPNYDKELYYLNLTGINELIIKAKK